MKLLLDENIPASLATALASAGFDISNVRDLMCGDDDAAILAYSGASELIIVTADKDFGELVYRHKRDFFGVVLVRAHPISDHVESIVRVLTQCANELEQAFVVIDGRGTVRVRRRT